MIRKKYIKNSKGLVRGLTTDYLNLEKPLVNENYDINIQNSNMDKIDLECKKINKKIDETKTELLEEIKDLQESLDDINLNASNINYDNSKSDLESSNVQDAIEEVNYTLRQKTSNIISDINKINFELKINNYTTSENMKYVFVDDIESESDVILSEGMFNGGKVHI